MTVDLTQSPEWTPEAVAAAGGDMVPLPVSERSRYFTQANPYILAGELPDLEHTDAARIRAVVQRRGLNARYLAGLVIQTESPSDRWYITFREPAGEGLEQTFYEASGGESEIFHADQFEAFLARLDIPTRMTNVEVRSGFRVIAFEPPRIAPRIGAAS